MEFDDFDGQVAARGRNPAVAVADGTPGAMRKSTAAYGWADGASAPASATPSSGRNDELAVILGLRFCPNLLHCLDALAHPFEAGGVHCSMVLRLASAELKNSEPLSPRDEQKTFSTGGSRPRVAGGAAIVREERHARFTSFGVHTD